MAKLINHVILENTSEILTDLQSILAYFSDSAQSYMKVIIFESNIEENLSSLFIGRLCKTSGKLYQESTIDCTSN